MNRQEKELAWLAVSSPPFMEGDTGCMVGPIWPEDPDSTAYGYELPHENYYGYFQKFDEQKTRSEAKRQARRV